MPALGQIELALLTVALWAALRPLVRLFRPEARVGVFPGLVAVAALVSWTALAARRPPVIEAEVADRPARVSTGGYVSSDTCRECHPREHGSWHASYHRTMTQVATADTVVAPLDEAPIVGGARYELRQRGDDVTVVMPDPSFRGRPADAPRVERRLVMTTGSHHEQDYWFATGDGRAVAHLPIVYRIAEGRWLPNGATFLQPPPPDAPVGVDHAGWNRNCIQCHATAGRPRFGDDGVRTEVGELGIACEACHGPAAEHVAANRDPRRRYAFHYARRTNDDTPDPTIVNPRRLDPERASEVCGQCHMVSTVTTPAAFPDWNLHGPAFRPGARLADTRDILPNADRPELAGFVDGRFWPDGVVRVTGRELHDVRASGCAQHGTLSCLSCHDMHQRGDDPRPAREWADDQLTPNAIGDAACVGCHPAIAADVPAHSHHGTGSPGSACMNCHMPYTTWGLLKAIRSHRIDSPSVASSLATGRPNACNLCHLDRPLAWAAERLEAWYGTPMPALGETDRTVAAAVRWLAAGDAGQRALVAWGMGWAPARGASARAPHAGGAGTDDGWMVPLLAQALDDPYDAVRFVAARTLAAHGITLGDYDFLAPPAARAAARDAIVAVSDAAARPAPDGAVVLQDDGGRLDRAALETLVATRDHRPVVLKE